MSKQPDETQLKQIKALLQAGRHDEATRLYREITGAGIFETKDALAELESQLPTRPAAKANQSGFLVDDDVPFATQDNQVFDDLADIRLLCRQGEKIRAIKLYRERKAVSLEEAKRVIDAMSTDDASFSGGSPPPQSQASFGPSDEVDQFILSGQKIMAIKLYRERYMVELKEAKDAVDARETVLRASSPERFSQQHSSGQSSSGPGAGFMFCMVLLMLALIYWYLSV